MDKVQIIPDEKGNVIRQSENPEYGYVKLQQKKEVYSNGWLNVKPVTTLLHGKLEDFKSIDMKNKTELPGRVIVKESTTPFDEQNPDRDLKIAGSTGVVCCAYGEPIYRKTIYDATSTLEDEYVAHTNGDAIKEANAKNQAPALNNLFKELRSEENEKTSQIDLEDSIKEVESLSESAENAEDFIEEEATEEVLDEIEDDAFEL